MSASQASLSAIGLPTALIMAHSDENDTLQGLGAPEEMLRALFDSVPDRLLLLDLDLRIRFANRGIFGTPRDKVMGRPIFDFLPESDHERVRELYRQSIATSGPKVYESRQAIHGETRWFENRVGPVVRAGRVVALAVACSEITARRRSEEALRVLEREITEIANREQRRIGNDLHDGLGQELTGIALMLTSLVGRLHRENHAAVKDAEEIVGLVNRTIESARALARGLSPVSIERGGLTFALRALSSQASDMYGVKVRFHNSRIWPQLTLEASGCNHLYRIAQEAVTNAVRHGKATKIIIDLHVKGDVVTLTVSDNGRGFTPGTGMTSGMGLRIMQYRAKTLGGSITFDTRPGGGMKMVSICRQPASIELPAMSQV